VPGFTLPGDTSEASRYFREDIGEPPVVLNAGGFIDVPHGPGIGVTVLEERVAKFRIDEERLR
jgi:O-succinylbenzoate synthase